MRALRSLFVLLLAALLTGLVVPPAGARPTQERYSISGVMAEASWFSEEETPVGVPRAIAVFGADATNVVHVAGSKPASEPQVSGVAMALMLPGPNPGDDPVPAEVWAVTDHPAFSYDRKLTRATLSFDAVAEVLGIDPETGEEVPTGVTFDVSVVASWVGTGGLTVDRGHGKYVEPGFWSIDHGRSVNRPAVADVTITTPDGTLFDGQMTDAQIMRIKAATLTHTR